MIGRRKWRSWSYSLHCGAEDREVVPPFSLLLAWFDEQSRKFVIKNGEPTHQVHIENRAVIAVNVHIHGALLGGEADGAVLQGEGWAGCNVLSETDKQINLCGGQHWMFIVWAKGSWNDADINSSLICMERKKPFSAVNNIAWASQTWNNYEQYEKPLLRQASGGLGSEAHSFRNVSQEMKKFFKICPKDTGRCSRNGHITFSLSWTWDGWLYTPVN